MLYDMVRNGFEPDALARRPALDGPLHWWLRCFFDLSRSRPITMGGAAPIPFTEIQAYLQIHGIDDIDERAHFCRRIGELDAAYLAYGDKKTKS